MNGLMKNVLIISFLLICVQLFSQNSLPISLSKKVENQRYLRFMFYNCENLFDTFDDSLKNDNEFLPDGDKYWNKYKYYERLHKTSKVIMAIGGWKAPELVGLCEIENRKVLHDLTKNTKLYQAEYNIIHKESPDNRGIDVALLYSPKAFSPIKTEFIKVLFNEKDARPTRDILYVKGITNQSDTLHIFINHWPSRWGGELETEDKRAYVALLVKQKTDSIFVANPNANIIVTGDLNDEPNNTSVKDVLKAQLTLQTPEHNKLYNLTQIARLNQNIGSHKYQGVWGVLDHIIVSGNLLNANNSIFCKEQSATIFCAPFLLETDETYLGEKPKRTYIGFKYNSGFSDHLPVFFDLQRQH